MGKRTITELQENEIEIWIQISDDNFQRTDQYRDPSGQILSGAEVEARQKKKPKIIIFRQSGDEPIKDEDSTSAM
jgi:hypothetical protein